MLALEKAKSHYQEETDTELEYETRNGNTVVVQLAVDPNRPGVKSSSRPRSS